jgi:hypothetical protein
MIPILDESAPVESSATEMPRRSSRQSPDVFGRFPENRDPDPEIPEILQ